MHQEFNATEKQITDQAHVPATNAAPAYLGNKIFIIGLPRTGTTSVSVALLEHGLKVAHMAFTQHCVLQADAISDVPMFSDYRQLDKLFAGAKFVYLERPLSLWVPSMQMLLGKMLPHLDGNTGKFHPIMKRSFNQTFLLDSVKDAADAQHLERCYLSHQEQVLSYFAGRHDLLRLDISAPGSLSQLLDFIGQGPNSEAPQQLLDFPKLNCGTDVAGWGEYKHPNKISSHAAGPMHRKYFDYEV
ncbi:sulfotransferase family protein [Shewanella sp. SNU WT4]|uniref:sulfotransferase n=1 Tax=Shewanella sp. SNU WT4 TaxID=2590015 RepID=UPI00112ACD3B|nr:sulfotransferase [Shewanella sp. SNU WT4]QDF68372.1 sulfotransferase family protein [Shewanella sp. SNU WT4]